MYLKSIELSGFKSFAKSSTLEFNSAISAIVGPNGSGKSNVAEAFRFVLGEQSIKSLRGKKGEDLIFNGAGGESRANRASVKVTFDNSDKTFGIDFPEVTIERVVHRDGVNDYLINGSIVRLKDVIELLAQAHIGASGHHIISQGEADKILNASTKDRKAMIEDALGLKIFQYKRLEADRKLLKTRENIAQVEGLRKEIAPHLKFLRKQAEKIEKAEEMRGELVALALEYLKREEEHIHELKGSIAEERKPIDVELSKLAKESQDAKDILKFESNLASAREKKDTLMREIGKLEGLIAAEERAIAAEHRRQASEESRTILLKEVEGLYDEVRALDTIEKIIQKIKSFISERRHATDATLVKDAEASIKEYRDKRAQIEKELKQASEKELEIAEAEKQIFRTQALESELVAKLNVVKMREHEAMHIEDDFKRMLAELGHLLGHDVLEYKNHKVTRGEDRGKQEERRRNLERLKIRFEESGVSGAGDVLKEFKDVTERDEFLGRELVDLESSSVSLRELISNLEERLAHEFETGVGKINKEFGSLFELMFGGGEARLILTREKHDEALEEFGEEPVAQQVEEGLDISVSLPRKKIKGLMMLSGGERALTSIALLFAISSVNPPPFIILDETDAALDEANSKKYGDMAASLSKHSQLILITHNRETMSRAGIIYGVTMGSTGVSKLLSIQFDEAVRVAK